MNYNSVGLMSYRLTNNNLKNIYSLTCTNKNARGVVRNLLRGGGLNFISFQVAQPPPLTTPLYHALTKMTIP